MPAARVQAAVEAAVEQVELGGQAMARLRTLSGGMLRRAGIAQAIVNEPELLLLDEPTAGLDPEQRVAFCALLRDLGQRATVVVSTHLVEDVGAACAQVALMDQGKIVFHGTPVGLTACGERHSVIRNQSLLSSLDLRPLLKSGHHDARHEPTLIAGRQVPEDREFPVRHLQSA